MGKGVLEHVNMNSTSGEQRRSKRLKVTSQVVATRLQQGPSTPPVVVTPTFAAEESDEDDSSTVSSLSEYTSRYNVRTYDEADQVFPPDLVERVKRASSAETKESADTRSNGGDLRGRILPIVWYVMEGKTFIGKDERFRSLQEETIEAILRKEHMEKDDTFQLLSLLTIISARGDIVPPRTISLPSSNKIDNSRCVEDETNILPDESILRTQSRLYYEGVMVHHGIANLLKRALIELHKIIPKGGSPTTTKRREQIQQRKKEILCKASKICTMVSIVGLWLRVIGEEKWGTCKEMRNYQLDIVDEALDEARDSPHDVRQALVYLVQYFSMTVEWPSESCTKDEREDLQTIARIMSHKEDDSSTVSSLSEYIPRYNVRTPGLVKRVRRAFEPVIRELAAAEESNKDDPSTVSSLSKYTTRCNVRTYDEADQVFPPDLVERVERASEAVTQEIARTKTRDLVLRESILRIV